MKFWVKPLQPLSIVKSVFAPDVRGYEFYKIKPFALKTIAQTIDYPIWYTFEERLRVFLS